jgi:aminomethyltransferase
MSQGTETLKRTPLHDRHVAAGARLVPYAGWEMPVQYTGIREEHKAVRNQVGIFDVSHMGEIETEGTDAEAFLQHILSNDVTKIAQDGAQYSVLCNEAGGVLDDLFTYRLGHDRFLTVTNAANHEKDLAWFQRHAADFDVRIHDRISDYAMLAIQGPEARALVQRLSDGELPKRFRTATLQVAGVDALVAGTGYTGEDGVEILTAPGNAPTIWDAATQEGAQPAGLGARDTLRLEVCFHLYGNDLSEDRGPIEAGLGWCCKEDTNFVGSDIVRAARENGTPEKLVPFALTGPGIARQGNAINGGGVVTSGTLSPCLDIGIGMAYLPAEKAVPGTPFEIDVRGKTRPAEVRTKPLYSKES